jgi:NADH:ubiquinone oxidoreductase subunit 6 (subunit J)
MTTAPPVRPEAIALPERGTGERQRRRQERRRLVRQQATVVLVFVIALAITVLVLWQQSRESGPSGADTTGNSNSTATTVGGPR